MRSEVSFFFNRMGSKLELLLYGHPYPLTFPELDLSQPV